MADKFIELNQFAPNKPLDGLYVYMANEGQLHNVIVGADTTLYSGNVVALDTSSTNTNAPVVVAAESTDAPFGVVAFTPVQAAHTTGARVGLAREHDVIWKKAASSIAVGDYVTFDSNYAVETAGAGEVYIGIALTPASAKDDFIQVELHFGAVAGE